MTRDEALNSLRECTGRWCNHETDIKHYFVDDEEIIALLDRYAYEVAVSALPEAKNGRGCGCYSFDKCRREFLANIKAKTNTK